MTRIEEFPQLADGARRIFLRIESGDMTVTAGEGLSWSLAWDADRDSPPRLTRDGDVIRIETDRDAWRRGADVNLTAPAGLDGADLHTGSGDVEVTGLTGESKVNTGSGDVELRSCAGELRANTGSGDIEIADFDGRLHANSGSGDLEAKEIRGDVKLNSGQGDIEVTFADGELQANTGHGDLEIHITGTAALNVNTGAGDVEIAGGSLKGLRGRTGAGDLSCSSNLLAGDYELHTGAGDAEIELPNDARARINAQTGQGEIESDVPLVRVGRSGPMGFGGGRMVGSVGEGEPEIELNIRTGAGDIRIRRAGGRIGGVSVSPDRVRAGNWEVRMDDQAGELRIGRGTDAEPMVSVPIPRGIGAYVRRAIQESLGSHGHGRREERQAEREERRAERRGGSLEGRIDIEIEREVEAQVDRGVAESIRASTPEPPEPPSAPHASRDPLAPQDETTIQILESLARGEISVDEAQARLREAASRA